MSYFSKYGITEIRDTKYDNLSINWDYEDDPLSIAQRKAVLLYTPSMDDTDEHFHIELTLDQCKELNKWLEAHIQEKESVLRRDKK